MTILVAGLVNLETSAPVESFPIEYAPARYPSGIRSTVSGVGWNVATALGTLGSRTRLLAAVGDDPAGQVVRAESRAAPFEALLVPVDRTPQSVILHEPTGRRTILTDPAGVESLRIDPAVIAASLRDCDLAVLCNVNWTRSMLTPVAQAGIPIATDLHAVTGLDNPYDADYLDAAGILFVSGEVLPETPSAFAARVMARAPADVLGIGLGDRGALVATRRSEPVLIPAPTLRPVVSTTGAGDALLAAFVHFHVRGMPASDAMRRAVVFASWTVGTQGGSEGFLTEAALERLLSEL